MWSLIEPKLVFEWYEDILQDTPTENAISLNCQTLAKQPLDSTSSHCLAQDSVLRGGIMEPTRSKAVVQRRQRAVQFLIDNHETRKKLGRVVKQSNVDIMRGLVSDICEGSFNIIDLHTFVNYTRSLGQLNCILSKLGDDAATLTLGNAIDDDINLPVKWTLRKQWSLARDVRWRDEPSTYNIRAWCITHHDTLEQAYCATNSIKCFLSVTTALGYLYDSGDS